MPSCAGCGGFVTHDFVRVFSAEGSDVVDTCPECVANANAGEEKDKLESDRGSAVAEGFNLRKADQNDRADGGDTHGGQQ